MSSNAEINGFGVDKVTRYGWTVRDQPGELKMVKKGLLSVDDSYQRDAISTKVLRIAAEWSWAACGAIAVGNRSGKLFVIDGQHRVLAALRRSDIDLLPCIIFETADIKQEASAFLSLNANRKPISSVGKLKAMSAAGDELAGFVTDSLKQRGISICHTSNKAREIKCVGACIKLAQMSKANFITALDATLAASPDVPIYERVLRGLFYIHTNVDGGLNDNKLLSRIVEIGGKRLVQSANRAQARVHDPNRRRPASAIRGFKFNEEQGNDRAPTNGRRLREARKQTF